VVATSNRSMVVEVSRTGTRLRFGEVKCPTPRLASPAVVRSPRLCERCTADGVEPGSTFPRSRRLWGHLIRAGEGGPAVGWGNPLQGGARRSRARGFFNRFFRFFARAREGRLLSQSQCRVAGDRQFSLLGHFPGLRGTFSGLGGHFPVAIHSPSRSRSSIGTAVIDSLIGSLGH
jgi:hypothetical protein